MNMSKHHTFTLEEYEEMEESMSGACIACGTWRDCCEPDAREYPCEECGKNTVYGAGELVLMGLIS
jgi:hypothetical protein